jgi:sugar lactone lactonase YvrE
MEKAEPSPGLLDWICAALLVAGCGGGTDADGTFVVIRSCGAGPCVSTIAGSGEFGTADGPAEAAQFWGPHALAVDALSRLHVADFGTGNQTRLVSIDGVSTLPEDTTDFPFPSDVAVDAAGNKYVTDPYGNRILEVTPDGDTSVVAGTGQSGDQDGDAATATFSMPSGLVFDAQGALYVADMGNRKIRKITFPAPPGG